MFCGIFNVFRPNKFKKLYGRSADEQRINSENENGARNMFGRQAEESADCAVCSTRVLHQYQHLIQLGYEKEVGKSVICQDCFQLSNFTIPRMEKELAKLEEQVLQFRAMDGKQLGKHCKHISSVSTRVYNILEMVQRLNMYELLRDPLLLIDTVSLTNEVIRRCPEVAE